MEKIIVIPAYEPDDKLIKLINQIKDTDYNVIVVNDGSNKTYDKIFMQIMDSVIYLNHDVNKGKGAALKTAYKYIKDNYKEYSVVTMDSDGQHKVSDAMRIFNQLEKNNKLFVLGMRKDTDKTPLRSRVGHIITRNIFGLVTGNYIYDTQTGLRGFTHINMDYMLNTFGNRFEYEMNVLLNLGNIKVKEIVIDTIYFDNHTSHFNTFKDSFKIYKELFKFAFSSISSFILDYILYLILFVISSNIIFANVVARLVSSIYNYNMNKKIVFHNKSNYSILKYYLLVVICLIINTFFLNILSNYLNPIIAKILIEIFLFFFSFIIQKIFIFKMGKK